MNTQNGFAGIRAAADEVNKNLGGSHFMRQIVAKAAHDTTLRFGTGNACFSVAKGAPERSGDKWWAFRSSLTAVAGSPKGGE